MSAAGVVTNQIVPLEVKLEIILLETLLNTAQKGLIRVPVFQRDFVWRPEQMRDLFTSIRRGYPIGSLLLWDTDRDYVSHHRIGPIEVPPRQPNKEVSYLLDGQQRLSTLLGVLRLGAQEASWEWSVYYDLKTGQFEHHPRGEPPRHYLPLRSVLRTQDYLAYCQTLNEALPGEADGLIDRAGEIAGQLKAHQISLIRIKGGTLDEAVEIFARLNSTGRPISADEMLSALTYREGHGGFHLARRIEQILEELGEQHYGTLARVLILRAVSAIGGREIVGEDWSVLAKDTAVDIPGIVDRAAVALGRAVRFLREGIGVPAAAWLPYGYQAVMLAVFFDKCENPDEGRRRVLEQWFWATSFAGWFGGANSAELREVRDGLRSFAEGGAKETLGQVGLAAPPTPFPRRFDLRSARVRTLLLAVAKRLPPRALTAPYEPVALKELLGPTTRPAYVFRSAGPEAGSPGNRVLLPEARQVGDRLRQLAGSEEGRLVLASHAIDADAVAALEGDDRAAFIRCREGRLRELEQEVMRSVGIEPPPVEPSGEAEEPIADADADEPLVESGAAGPSLGQLLSTVLTNLARPR